jgi:glycerol uptake facilitator-like aquaporin
MYTRAFVEFLGTALIVGAFAFLHSPILVVAALAIALGFGGKVSGGHFNPAITAWALAKGDIGVQRAMSYFVAQFGAAVMIFMLSSIISV